MAEAVKQVGQESQVLSLDEIFSKFSGRYVAMAVTARDAEGQPTHGRVLEVHFDKYKLKDSFQMYKDVCIFFAGPIPKPGYLAVF